MAKLKDGFYKQTAEDIGSDLYVLLAGGGSKALSDFATASSLSDYVTLATAQTISGVKTFSGGNIPIRLNSTGNDAGVQFLLSGAAKGWVGHTNTTGTYIYNYPSAKYIGVKDDGTPYYYSGGFKTLLHSGNYTEYTVQKDGTGASGTWGINITGNASTATDATYTSYIKCPDTRSVAYDIQKLQATLTGVSFDFKSKEVSGLSADFSGIMTYRPYATSTDWTGGPAHLLAFDLDGLHYRQYDGSGFTTWKTLAYTTDIPTVTNYYWANVPISASSSTSTSPTFASAIATNHINIGYAFGHRKPNRAELSLISPGAYPVDIILGADSTNYWSITVRNSTDSNSKGFVIYDFTSSVDRLVINPSGNVGVNTSAPRSVLDVYGTDAAVIIGKTSLAPGVPSARKLRLGLGTAGHSGSEYWAFCIDDTTDSSYLQIGYTEDTVGISIRHDGALGIGHNYPYQRLTINGNIAFTSTGIIGTSYSSSDLTMYNNITINSSTNGIQYYSGSWTSRDHVAHNFLTGNSNSSRLTIMNSGYVGIGTVSPAYTLEVAGNVASDSVYANKSGSSTSGGISLYYGSSPDTYGIMFRGTASSGTHGKVTSDWATYFTMNDQTDRGWIFRRGTTNVASVSSGGAASFPAVGTDKYIAYPEGGQYTYSYGSITGAIKIKLPVRKSSTMLSFKVTIYNYVTGTSSVYFISGYNYSENGNWYNCTAYSLRQGTAELGNLTVRYGNDGSYDCVWIGETTTSWDYPNIVISDVLLGYDSQAFSTWATGWTISIVSSFNTVYTSISNTALNHRALTVGDGSITMIPQYNNEINFGGTNGSGTICFGYRATDSRPIPTSFVFGDSTGSATLTSSGFKKKGSSDSYVLLGGGSHKLESSLSVGYAELAGSATTAGTAHGLSKSFTVFGVSFNGAIDTTVDMSTLIEVMGTGDSNITDSTHILTSHVSGFNSSGNTTTIYKRTADYLWNYIKGKIDSTYTHGASGGYLPLTGGTMTGSLTFNLPSSNRRVGIIGTYDPDRAAAIWSMGDAYQISTNGLSFGGLYGAAYAYFGSGYTFGANYSLGHSFVWCQAGTPSVALGNNIWTKGSLIADCDGHGTVKIYGTSGGSRMIEDLGTANGFYIKTNASWGMTIKVNTNEVVIGNSTKAMYTNQVLDLGTSTKSWGDLYAAGGKFYVTSDGAYHTSDIRKKTNITKARNLDISDLLVEFDWKESGKHSWGYIAQDLLEVLPEAVDYNEDIDVYSVNYNVAHSAAIASLTARIKELEEKLKKYGIL